MNHNEWQTDDSILAAPADEATEQAADLVIAAADEDKLTPAKLGQLLVSVGRTVSDEDDLLTLLQRVVEIAHDAIDGADSTSLTIDLGGRTYTAVHTDDRTLRVDSEQYDAGEGPCLEASRTGAVVLVNADDPEDRWPRFTAASREEEILSFLAAPLITGEQSLGPSTSTGTLGRRSTPWTLKSSNFLPPPSHAPSGISHGSNRHATSPTPFNAHYRRGLQSNKPKASSWRCTASTPTKLSTCCAGNRRPPTPVCTQSPPNS
jgi:hypothetical protein